MATPDISWITIKKLEDRLLFLEKKVTKLEEEISYQAAHHEDLFHID